MSRWITVNNNRLELCGPEYRKTLKTAIALDQVDVYQDLIKRSMDMVWRKDGDRYTNMLDSSHPAVSESEMAVFTQHIQDRPDGNLVTRMICDGWPKTKKAQRAITIDPVRMRKWKRAAMQGELVSGVQMTSTDSALPGFSCTPRKIVKINDVSVHPGRTETTMNRWLSDDAVWRKVCVPLSEYSHNRWVRDAQLACYLHLVYGVDTVDQETFNDSQESCLVDPLTLAPYYLKMDAAVPRRIYQEGTSYSRQHDTTTIAEIIHGMAGRDLYASLQDCVPLFDKKI